MSVPFLGPGPFPGMSRDSAPEVGPGIGQVPYLCPGTPDVTYLRRADLRIYGSKGRPATQVPATSGTPGR